MCTESQTTPHTRRDTKEQRASQSGTSLLQTYPRNRYRFCIHSNATSGGGPICPSRPRPLVLRGCTPCQRPDASPDRPAMLCSGRLQVTQSRCLHSTAAPTLSHPPPPKPAPPTCAAAVAANPTVPRWHWRDHITQNCRPTSTHKPTSRLVPPPQPPAAALPWPPPPLPPTPLRCSPPLYACAATGSLSCSLVTRFLSPYTLSTRLTVGQNLACLTHGAGNAAFSLL